MTGPMVMTALTTVVVTVLMTLGVTNRLVTVTGDVTRDIPMATVAKVMLKHYPIHSFFMLHHTNVYIHDLLNTVKTDFYNTF